MLSILSQLFLADAGTTAAAGIGAFMIVIWALAILATVFVIWMLVDCLTSNMPTNEKILWALVIIFLHLLGAIIYYAVKRSGSHGPRMAT